MIEVIEGKTRKELRYCIFSHITNQNFNSDKELQTYYFFPIYSCKELICNIEKDQVFLYKKQKHKEEIHLKISNSKNKHSFMQNKVYFFTLENSITDEQKLINHLNLIKINNVNYKKMFDDFKEHSIDFYKNFEYNKKFFKMNITNIVIHEIEKDKKADFYWMKNKRSFYVK